MLKSLRAALAQYALGEDGGGEPEIVAPIEERVTALLDAIEATEAHLLSLGFDVAGFTGATGFARIAAVADAEAAVYTSDEAKRRFEILARQVFVRFKALVMEPSAFTYAERHDNLEAIYKKLEERCDKADITDLLKELHRIVNEAIRTAAPGDDQRDSRMYDLSAIDLEKLRDEFAKRASRKATVVEDIRQLLERKLADMLAQNPQRMDYYRKYSEIVADYNREKDRVTVEDTFAKLVDLANNLDVEQRRATEEGLSEEELALFDLLLKTRHHEGRSRARQAGESRAPGVDSCAHRAAGALDRQGANASRSRGVHPRQRLQRLAEPAIFRRRQTGSSEARVSTYLAAECRSAGSVSRVTRTPAALPDHSAFTAAHAAATRRSLTGSSFKAMRP